MRSLLIVFAVVVALVVCGLQLGNRRMLEAEERGRPAAAAGPTPGAPSTARRPAVAGAFYPADPTELQSMVDKFLQSAKPMKALRKPLAIIAPHAGYVYSGAVAGFAYAAVKGQEYDTVVVVGPSHGALFAGAAVPRANAWNTPLGNVSIDTEMRAGLLAADERFVRRDGAMAQEHSIEVQLPFLQRAIGKVKVLPIQVADFSVENLSAITDALCEALQGKSALLIASTDMSHYPAYEDACEVDKKTLDLLEGWRLADLIKWEHQAPASGVKDLHCALCGLGPTLIVMRCAARLGANSVSVLRYANSGDVLIGDRGRCVGYCAVALWRDSNRPAADVQPLRTVNSTDGGERTMHTSEGELSQEQQRYLLTLARDAVGGWVARSERVTPERREGVLSQDRAVFVTLKEQGMLRGCIGSLVAREPLVDAVVGSAIAAATQDPRFRPVAPDELSALDIHVSVLSPSTAVSNASEIEIGKHGIIVQQAGRSGVFLPEVATEQGWTLEETLTHLCAEKAGLPADAWKTGAKLLVFTTQSFGDGE